MIANVKSKKYIYVMLPKKLQKKLDDRKTAATFRQLPVSRPLVDFASNDYLGYSRDHSITARSLEILKTNNISANGATGSRLLSGNHKLYTTCEEIIAQFHESDTALIFNSGYDANIGFFQSVPQRGDIILYDAYIHASIRDGIGMSNAKSYKFKHNDVENLTQLLLKHQDVTDEQTNQTIYVITESVFSMDGDSPDLNAMTALCTASNALLVVDEAHAVSVFGNTGQGLVHALQLQEQIFARIITFGKGLGAHGAAILGSKSLRDYLINFARSFIYTTGLPPHSVATIMAAYEGLKRSPSQANALHDNIGFFVKQLAELNLQDYFIQSNSAIQCAIVPGNKKVKMLASQCKDAGFDVKPILSPTVAEGEERLRFCLHSFNSLGEIKSVLSLLATYLEHELHS